MILENVVEMMVERRSARDELIRRIIDHWDGPLRTMAKQALIAIWRSAGVRVDKAVSDPD